MDKITDALCKEMWKAFKALGKEALTMNHYDLAEATPVSDTETWKQWLRLPAVSKYIAEEFSAIQDSELRKLIMNISDSSSVGKAQLINSLSKLLDKSEGVDRSGPTYIYTYVPLAEEEKNADNVEELENDPFITPLSR